MTETVVHVTTLEQWKSVLDVWFEQGYDWSYPHDNSPEYHEEYFHRGQRFIRLSRTNKILQGNFNGGELIKYSDFMAQQEDEMAKQTYYVTQEQLDLIEYLNDEAYPLLALAMNTFSYGSDFEEKFDPNILFTDEFIGDSTLALTKYLGGDTSIKFKVKEQLYRLWRIDDSDNRVYMQINGLGTPIWTTHKHEAFTAPLDEIKKWQTPAWEIEKAD